MNFFEPVGFVPRHDQRTVAIAVVEAVGTQIVERIDSPWFGVNYDPSNAIVAGEDPLAVLQAVKRRVVTMHASDRYLTGGTLEDLKQQDGRAGYARNLAHGRARKRKNNAGKQVVT